jgi:glycosyltransferase involved in cell wall biosynthesis
MTPRVSIVTTVYDRLDCLRRCLRSVQHLAFRDFEQIVVSDAPGEHIEGLIDGIVAEVQDPRIRHLRQPERSGNWGRTPAIAAMRESVGEFVCFLSDDNAYLPNHFGPLLAAFETDPDLGFVYSSCLYGGHRELRHCPPIGAGVDLGQPLFRRAVIRQHLQDDIPFPEFAWDWRLINFLMLCGVRWQHIDEASFVFRLDAYPAIAAVLA